MEVCQPPQKLNYNKWKMNYNLSLSASKQLQEWGCDVESNLIWYAHRSITMDDHIWSIGDYEHNFPYYRRELCPSSKGNSWLPTYNLRDIIYSGEMAKAFFGEKGLIPREEHQQYSDCDCSGRDMSFEQHIILPSITQQLLFLLQQGKKEEAEQYLLENTIFNPKNKD